MSEQNLEPTPRGWLEKAYDANVFTMLTVALLVPVLYPLNDRMGFWLSVVMMAVAVAAVTVLVALPVIPVKKLLRRWTRNVVSLNAPIGRLGPHSSKDGRSDTRKQSPDACSSK